MSSSSIWWFIPALVLTCGSAAAQNIPYKASVTIAVGKSMVLKGVRGPCGGPAPSWDQVGAKLPKTTLGRFSDGGVGTVVSRSCNGTTAARGVRFTATAKGAESFVIFDDPISITVN